MRIWNGEIIIAAKDKLMNIQESGNAMTIYKFLLAI